MPDDFDRAAALEQQQRQRALEAQRGRGYVDRPSLAECEACGEDIPEARQAFGGITLCIDCQTEREERERKR